MRLVSKTNGFEIILRPAHHIDTYIFKKNLLWFILGSGPGGAVGRSAAFGSLEGDARRSREAREDIFDVDHSLRWEGRPGITPKR